MRVPCSWICFEMIARVRNQFFQLYDIGLKQPQQYDALTFVGKVSKEFGNILGAGMQLFRHANVLQVDFSLDHCNHLSPIQSRIVLFIEHQTNVRVFPIEQVHLHRIQVHP